MPTFVELLLSGTLCYTSYMKYFFPDLQYNHNPKSADKTTERLIYSGHRAGPEIKSRFRFFAYYART